MTVPADRVRVCNDKAVAGRGDYVLYLDDREPAKTF
jgi:hypothetical protein